MATAEPDSGKASGRKLPVCFPMLGYADAAKTAPSGGPAVPAGRHRLHGADDLMTLFGLRPLWDRSVRAYAPSGSGTKLEAAQETDAAVKDSGMQDESSQQQAKPQPMDKTYGCYVQDLPGKVRPNRKLMTRYNAAANSASAAGQAAPVPPVELSGRTTMRDIVFRPETTIQRVGPFDDETLRAAFTVAAGQLPDIDLSLLESDGPERGSPSKRKKKRKHPRDADDPGRGEDSASAKRSKLQAFAAGSGA